jgi:hypothetical protein
MHLGLLWYDYRLLAVCSLLDLGRSYRSLLVTKNLT